MTKLNLNEYGVQELSKEESKMIDGGIAPVIIVGGIIVGGFLIGLGIAYLVHS